jgi:hypothetical protein
MGKNYFLFILAISTYIPQHIFANVEESFFSNRFFRHNGRKSFGKSWQPWRQQDNACAHPHQG